MSKLGLLDGGPDEVEPCLLAGEFMCCVNDERSLTDGMLGENDSLSWSNMPVTRLFPRGR